MPYTSTELIEDIKTRGAIPTSQKTFTEEKILRIANSAMRSKIVPIINKLQENYFSFNVDTLVNATGIYPINTRAVGAKLEDVCSVSGDVRNPLVKYREIDLQNLTEAPNEPGYYLKRNSIYTVPTVPPGAAYLRQSIVLRPNKIVSVDDAAEVTAIDTGTKIVTFSNVPATWTASDLYDFVQSKPHFDSLSIDAVAVAVVTGASGTIEFQDALPSGLAVGDWVSLAGETPIVQAPEDYHDLLAQEAANICLRAQTDPEALKNGIEEASEMRKDLMILLSPRVESSGKKIVCRSGILRRGI